MHTYPREPQDPGRFTRSLERTYTRIAGLYDLGLKLFPWRRSLLQPALPYLVGRRLLEVSFGTGYFMTQYADRFEVRGLDVNPQVPHHYRAKLEKG